MKRKIFGAKWMSWVEPGIRFALISYTLVTGSEMSKSEKQDRFFSEL